MKKLGALFYIVLGLLTIAVLVSLSLWIRFKSPFYLYFMLAAFAVYLFHLVFNLIRNDIEYRQGEIQRSSFLMLSQNIEAQIVYITYLGNEKRVQKPARYRKDYLIEFYSPDVKIDQLKKHLWYDLPEEEEKELLHSFIGGMDVPYPLLADISQKTVLLQAMFYEEAKDLPLFSDFFERNKIILYGE